MCKDIAELVGPGCATVPADRRADGRLKANDAAGGAGYAYPGRTERLVRVLPGPDLTIDLSRVSEFEKAKRLLEVRSR